MTTADEIMRLATNYRLCCDAENYNALRVAVSALVAERDALLEVVEYDAQCPCCTEIRECASDCTFHLECPNEAARMDCRRAALKGKP